MQALTEWNPHWFGGAVTPRALKYPQERAVVPHWLNDLLDPPDRMWALKPGPRQVGKTTSLGHVAKRLIEQQGVAARRVTIASLDDDLILDASSGRLETIIESAMEQRTPTPQEPAFLLLDEIQAFPDWAHQLKAAWDRHHMHLRVLATGSSAVKLLRPASADFHGRVRTVTVHPMKFREIVAGHPDTHKHADQKTLDTILRLARQARESLIDGHEAFGAAVNELHGMLEAKGLSRHLRQLWLEYCAWGGYPAVRPGAKIEPAQRLDRFEGAWSTIVANDVVAGGIRKFREFRLLMRHIALNPGGKFEPFGIGNKLDIPGQTIQEWKNALDDLMLVQQLPSLKTNLAPAKGRDKAYPTDPGWCSYFRGNVEPQIDPDATGTGLIVETVLVDHLRRALFNLQSTTVLPIGYAAKPEVDVVAQLRDKRLLFEAKYSTAPQTHLSKVGRPDDLRIVATRDRFETAPLGGSHMIPAQEIAFLC